MKLLGARIISLPLPRPLPKPLPNPLPAPLLKPPRGLKKPLVTPRLAPRPIPRIDGGVLSAETKKIEFEELSRMTTIIK